MTQTDTADVSRLYLALGRLNRELRREAAPGAAIGHGSLSALASLLGAGPMRLGALADIEGVSAPSMTRTISALEQLGHVRRTPDPKDGRAQLVEVTESGSNLVLQGRSQRMVALARRVEQLDPVDWQRLLDALPVLESLGES